MDHHLGCVNVVRWSNDGRFLASAGDDKLIMIWQKSAFSGGSIFGGGGKVHVEHWRLHQTLRLGFCEKDILSILSYFLSREKLTHKKSWAILKNVNLWMIKFQLYKKKLFVNLAKLVFLSILSSRNWSFAKLLSFFLSQFLSWEENLRERENLFFRKSEPKGT